MATKIFVVDDNAINLKLTGDILENAGYEVMRAVDAESALDMIKECQPDLVLMDIQLPGMDGLTATLKLKQDGATKHIPVVAITSFAMKGDDQKAFDAGCDGYITKPIDTRKLPSLIEETLRKVKSEKAI